MYGTLVICLFIHANPKYLGLGLDDDDDCRHLFCEVLHAYLDSDDGKFWAKSFIAAYSLPSIPFLWAFF